MKVILSMAVSANGIVATESGEEEFLSDETWGRFAKLANEIGCVVWGRKTYEKVIQFSQKCIDDVKVVRKIVLSKSDFELKEGYSLVKSPEEALKLLSSEGFERILISGGSTLNTEFARRNLIDEIILDINPVIIGVGVPLFLSFDFELKLRLKSTKIIEGGNVELVYEVSK